MWKSMIAHVLKEHIEVGDNNWLQAFHKKRFMKTEKDNKQENITSCK